MCGVVWTSLRDFKAIQLKDCESVHIRLNCFIKYQLTGWNSEVVELVAALVVAAWVVADIAVVLRSDNELMLDTSLSWPVEASIVLWLLSCVRCAAELWSMQSTPLRAWSIDAASDEILLLVSSPALVVLSVTLNFGDSKLLKSESK